MSIIKPYYEKYDFPLYVTPTERASVSSKSELARLRFFGCEIEVDHTKSSSLARSYEEVRIQNEIADEQNERSSQKAADIFNLTSTENPRTREHCIIKNDGSLHVGFES